MKKEYKKPTMRMVTLRHRSHILISSIEGKEYNGGKNDYADLN
jgi:hypothetical protein